MELPLKLDQGSGESLQSQLYMQIRQMILAKQLKPGTLLPATRVLSKRFGVSRNTVSITYDHLVSEGYLKTHVGSGTFVNDELPEESLFLKNDPQNSNPENVPAKDFSDLIVFRGLPQRLLNPYNDKLDIDFWIGRPDADIFPFKTWRRSIIRQLGKLPRNITDYGHPAGLLELRQAIADHLGPTRGISISPEQVIIVGGSQEALNIISRMLIEKGSSVATESPCYQGAAYVFESYGANLIPVPVDGYGIIVDEMPKTPISLLYVTPSHQYPMGVTMSLKRRLQLLEWVSGENGGYILEDDYDNDFRHTGSPLTALKGLDNCDSVIYMGTFSKCLGAGLRLGYLVVPHAMIEPATTIKTLLDNGHPWLEQAALADFITSGSFFHHLRRIRQICQARRDYLIQSLRRYFGDVDLSGTESGMHIVWRLPSNFPSVDELLDIALGCSVGIYSPKTAYAYSYPQHSDITEGIILLGYSSTPEKQIEQGIKCLAVAVEDWFGENQNKDKKRAT